MFKPVIIKVDSVVILVLSFYYVNVLYKKYEQFV